MARQTFNMYWPQGLDTADELISGTAILQQRDGKDEPINLSGVMVFDPGSNLWVPASEDHPLEVRVGQLGSGEVSISGTFDTMSEGPYTARQLVGSTAMEIFAGANRLENRYAMGIYNESHLNLYWGRTGLTVDNGWPLLPGDSVFFRFDPKVPVPIFAISESEISVRVVEFR